MSVLQPCEQFNRNLGLSDDKAPRRDFPLSAAERHDAEFAERFGETEPQPPAPVDHVESVVHAAVVFNVANIKWINDANRKEYAQHPPYRVLEPLAQLFVTFAQEHAKWPRTSWPFLYQLRAMATLILPLAPQWFDQNIEWPKDLFLSDALDRSLQPHLDPPPAPERRAAAMESLADLRKLGVIDTQICNMVGWFTPTGAPDLARLWRAESDPVAEPWPTMLELPPTPDGLPDSPPLLGIVYDVGALAAAALAAE